MNWKNSISQIHKDSKIQRIEMSTQKIKYIKILDLIFSEIRRSWL